MKRLIILLFLAGTAYAQNTVVSATMVDSSGQVYANGTWKVDFFPTPNTPGPFTQQGSSFTQHFNGNLTSNGSFTVTVADNSTIVPARSKWTFTVCPNATFQCTSTSQTITGATVDLSPIINALLPSSLQDINPFPNFAAAYQNLNIGPPYKLTDGSAYFNTTNGQPCWFYHGAWTCISGSTGPGNGLQSVIGTGAATATITGTTATVNVPIGEDVSRYSGTDMCAKINAAMLAKPGIPLIAQSFTGGQACASNPFANSIADVVIYFGDVTINTTVPWVTNSRFNTLIYGNGRGSNGRGTNIVAVPGFPSTCDGLTVGCPVLRLGDFSGGTNGSFGQRVENLTVDCNGQPGSIGIYSNDIQEQSGAVHFQVLDCPIYGIFMDGSFGQGKGAENYFFEDGEVLGLTKGTSTTVNVKIVGNTTSATSFRKLENITSGCNASNPCSTAYSFENTTGGILMGLNAEGVTFGYDIGPNSNSVGGITAVHLVCGGSGNLVQKCVWIHPASINVNLSGIENGSGQVSIQDDTAKPSANSITDFFMSYYITTDNGANRLSSSHYPQNSGNGNLFTSLNINSLNGAPNPFSVRQQTDFGLTMTFDSGVTASQGVSFVLADRGTGEWTIQNTGSSGGAANTDAFQIFDIIGNIPRLYMASTIGNTGYSILDSAGSSAVSINKGASSGTGGFEVCAGNSTCNFRVSSSGVVTDSGQTGITANITISGCTLIFTGGIVTGHSGSGCP